MVDKYIKDGKVAVLVSYGFGAGWSTWMGESAEAALFDPDIAKAIEVDDYELALKIAEEKYPGEYFGGLSDCSILWIDQGTEFFIDEYDGAESISFKNEISWHKA